MEEKEIDQTVLHSIPDSAFTDLNVTSADAPKMEVNRKLVPNFIDPISLPTFSTLLESQKVILESVIVDDSKYLKVSGFVRTLSLSSNKDVRIRYTLNCWETFFDVSAQFIGSLAPFEFSERYKFQIHANSVKLGGKLKFSIKFRTKDATIWDNCEGNYYVFDCAKDSPDVPEL